MTSIQTHHAVETSSETPAIATWLTSTDHKVVGRLYIGSGVVGLVAGLVLAVLVAVERIDADGYQILGSDTAAQLLAAARLLLTFGGLVPVIYGLSLAVVPL
ncbi:MAG: hypothetical protein ACO3SP_10690, partial [Ilumatobacteraceae bacterium]